MKLKHNKNNDDEYKGCWRSPNCYHCYYIQFKEIIKLIEFDNIFEKVISFTIILLSLLFGVGILWGIWRSYQ